MKKILLVKDLGYEKHLIVISTYNCKLFLGKAIVILIRTYTKVDTKKMANQKKCHFKKNYFNLLKLMQILRMQ